MPPGWSGNANTNLMIIAALPSIGEAIGGPPGGFVGPMVDPIWITLCVQKIVQEIAVLAFVAFV